ncbi:NERD domain-containing protein [Nitrospirota bacterium]
MARMIPPHISPDCPSPGEIELFHKFRTDQGTEDWIVLHSLDISNHIKQVSGECDFVVIIPQKGVLCIEVKACHKVRRDDGQWYYGNDKKPDPKGPFKQAGNAMHSIRKRILHKKTLSKSVFASAVIFPYLEFVVTSDEWHKWQVIDKSDLLSKTLHELLIDVFKNTRNHLMTKYPALKLPDTIPSDEQTIEIANILRPNFDFYESPASRVRRVNDEIKHYTEEQFIALDCMESNERVLFLGPAGTGKTLLALEAARRSANNNRRVLLLCFNKLLGSWLQRQSDGISSNITCKTLHSYMMSVSGIKPEQCKDDNRFWSEELPMKAISHLKDNDQGPITYDEIVLDEAQDIIYEARYLEFLDSILKGGLSGGSWKFFGDFERQTIYAGLDMNSIIGHLESRAGSIPKYSLRKNCRNTPRISSYARLLGGLEPDYSSILRPDSKVDPSLLYYSNDEVQANQLISCLERNIKKGMDVKDIIILSPFSDSHSIASKINHSKWSNKLKPYKSCGPNNIPYCSIHAFKGLERQLVIVTDIHKLSDSSSETLFYVAVTRALDRLVLLVQEDAKNDVINAILGK